MLLWLLVVAPREHDAYCSPKMVHSDMATNRRKKRRPWRPIRLNSMLSSLADATVCEIAYCGY